MKYNLELNGYPKSRATIIEADGFQLGHPHSVVFFVMKEDPAFGYVQVNTHFYEDVISVSIVENV